ncbi:MAG: malonate-semialdehyde dehydrogenase (acetylating) / methylmalonate-semialdehyde dehydrogenase [Actinomycetota bacterium]|nr:malonate-semialdehyde dehydrogenase (acetylating) / methylmalonate-semialdehyde dehydrogenase [Actinomycetota bacterium]
MKTIQHFIGGSLSEDEPEAWADVHDPAHGAPSGRVALGGAAAVDLAVKVALDAQAAWQEESLGARQQVILELIRLIEQNRDELALLVTSEHGKIFADARAEVNAGLEVAKFAAGIPHLLKGEFSENVSRGIDTYSIRQPLGVVAGITPFNFPVMVPMWMFPVAIACGNAFVLKPSEKDPSASNLLAELAIKAGLPAGILNVVHGGAPAVEALLAHPDVSAVSFVGSTPIAQHVYETAAKHGKRVQALGGAKNHLVVLPDANLDAAADALISAAYGSAGERCMAISVAVAVGDTGDALRDKLVERIGKLTTADGRDQGTDMGPLVTGDHLRRVSGYVQAGADAGADLVVDGRDIHVPGRENGFFLAPTLLDHVRPDMSVYTDEIFGPVLAMVRVATLEDAIALINSGEYGNGVSIFTRDGVAARRFQHAIQVGMIGLNVPIPVPMPYFPFGGWKKSLFGDSGQYGEDGIRFFTRRKVVTSRWIESGSGVDMRFPASK